MPVKKKTISAAKKQAKSKETKTTTTKKIVKRAVKATRPKASKKDIDQPLGAKLIAKVDVGWGNKLYARGEGAGLSWDQGVELNNESGDTWVFDATTETEDVVLKLLVNDEVWAEGDNLNLSQGKTIIVKPKFEAA